MSELMFFAETDMYAPVKKYFEAKGYVMRGEVCGIDAAAEKDGELILLEFKKSFNMKLIFQALDRQKISNIVYVVIPKPNKRGGNLPKITHIVKALNLGLITVDMLDCKRGVETVNRPVSEKKALNNKRTRKIKKELAGRSIDGNSAGSVNTKLLTAYREQAIKIAVFLFKHGELSPKQLRELGCAQNTADILTKNYYGWFYRVKNGVYFLTDEGFKTVEDGDFKAAVKEYFQQ